jgi:hypothetical protein
VTNEEQYAKSSLLQWVTFIVPTACAYWLMGHSGIAKNWQDLVVYSVLLFSGLISLFRPEWNKREFWVSLLGVFLLHTFAVVIVGQVWPRGSPIPKLSLSIVVLVEAMLVLSFLWKRTHARGGT